jgi:hypothetical protein
MKENVQNGLVNSVDGLLALGPGSATLVAGYHGRFVVQGLTRYLKAWCWTFEGRAPPRRSASRGRSCCLADAEQSDAQESSLACRGVHHLKLLSDPPSLALILVSCVPWGRRHQDLPRLRCPSLQPWPRRASSLRRRHSTPMRRLSMGLRPPCAVRSGGMLRFSDSEASEERNREPTVVY